MKRLHRISIAGIVTFTIFFVELIGGILFRSVSLIADSFHVIMDVIALFTSYFTLRMVLKPDWRVDYTFGYHRLEVLAALFNGASLSVTIFLIVKESIERLLNPVDIETEFVVVIAIIGFVANLISARILEPAQHSRDNHQNQVNLNSRINETEGFSNNECEQFIEACPTDACINEDINIKSAYLHVLGDALSSIVVIVGAIIIYFTDIYWLDPLLALVIATILIKGTYEVLKESFAAIMSKSPLDILQVEKFFKQVPTVTNVHDLHIWRLCPRVIMLSVHLKITTRDLPTAEKLIENIEKQLASKYNIQHITIQLETPETPIKACNICHD